jgi:hypothetical protein
MQDASVCAANIRRQCLRRLFIRFLFSVNCGASAKLPGFIRCRMNLPLLCAVRLDRRLRAFIALCIRGVPTGNKPRFVALINALGQCLPMLL